MIRERSEPIASARDVRKVVELLSVVTLSAREKNWSAFEGIYERRGRHGNIHEFRKCQGEIYVDS